MVGVRRSEYKTSETKLGWSKTKLEETGKTKLEEGRQDKDRRRQGKANSNPILAPCVYYSCRFVLVAIYS